MKIERLEDRKCFTVMPCDEEGISENIDFFVITNKGDKQDVYVANYPFNGLCEFVYSTVSPTVSETMESLLQWLKRDNNYEKLTEQYGNYDKAPYLDMLYSYYEDLESEIGIFASYMIDDSYILEIYDGYGADYPIVFVYSKESPFVKYAIGIDDDTFEYEDINIICKIIYDEFPDLDTISYRQSLEHEFEFCIKEYNKAMAELNKD